MAFAAPATQTGDSLEAKDILGQLVIAIGTELVKDVQTEFGVSDAIRADVVVLTQQNEDGTYGVIYRDIMWFNVSLRNTLKKQIGACVLARMGQGPKQPGKNAPFILEDATQDAQAVAFAEGWMDAHPDFEAEAQAKINGAGKVTAPAPQPAAVPAVPSVPQVPAVPQAAPAPVPAVPQVPATAPVPQATPAAPVVDMSALAALAPEEQQKILAQFMAGQAQIAQG